MHGPRHRHQITHEGFALVVAHDAAGELIARIETCTTGRDLLAVVMDAGPKNDAPDVAQARVEILRKIVKGAQSLAALDAMAKSFRPDWGQVEADADARRDELAQQVAA